MRLLFRWYGPSDPVTLRDIRQIPLARGVASAVYGVPPGEPWPMEDILAVRDAAAEHGLSFAVAESVPVPEEIKLGLGGRERLTGVFCETVRRLGRAGVACVCYNFMPVLDWFRTDPARRLPDGSTAPAYDEGALRSLDPLSGGFRLPGWAGGTRGAAEARRLTDAYREIGAEGLWENLEVFLKAAVPAAREAGVLLALHPDDPPWDLFGLPRIITGTDAIRRFLSLSPERCHGLTFCAGSLGADPRNDAAAMAGEFAPRIHFLHLRNIRVTGERRFEETAHPSACGSLDMYAIVKALTDNGFDGYARPDHGRLIWGETGRPGYGLYDRALGAAYLTGLFEAAEREKAERDRAERERAKRGSAEEGGTGHGG